MPKDSQRIKLIRGRENAECRKEEKDSFCFKKLVCKCVSLFGCGLVTEWACKEGPSVYLVLNMTVICQWGEKNNPLQTHLPLNLCFTISHFQDLSPRAE